MTAPILRDDDAIQQWESDQNRSWWQKSLGELFGWGKKHLVVRIEENPATKKVEQYLTYDVINKHDKATNAAHIEHIADYCIGKGIDATSFYVKFKKGCLDSSNTIKIQRVANLITKQENRAEKKGITEFDAWRKLCALHPDQAWKFVIGLESAKILHTQPDHLCIPLINSYDPKNPQQRAVIENAAKDICYDLWHPARVKDPEAVFWLLLQNSPDALLSGSKNREKSHSAKEILATFLNKNEYVQEVLTDKKELSAALIGKIQALIQKAKQDPENNSAILPKLYFLLPHSDALSKELMSMVPQLFANDRDARMQFYTDFGNWGTKDFQPNSDV